MGALAKLDISNNNIGQGEPLQLISEVCNTKGIELDNHESESDDDTDNHESESDDFIGPSDENPVEVIIVHNVRDSYVKNMIQSFETYLGKHDTDY